MTKMCHQTSDSKYARTKRHFVTQPSKSSNKGQNKQKNSQDHEIFEKAILYGNVHYLHIAIIRERPKQAELGYKTLG